MEHLTITRLTLLVLGGCSQESTELERCIEANIDKTVPSSFNLKWFSIKEPPKWKGAPQQSDFDKCLFEYPLAMKYVNEIDKLFWERLKATEKEDKELDKELDKESERIKDKYYSDLKFIWEICEDTEKRKAEKVCNSQGIY